MDYKKLIKSRKVREAILYCLALVPDKQMIRIQYKIKTGRSIDYHNAQRYSEKMQLYKLYFREEFTKRVVDKATAKKYVSDCGYPEIVTPTILVSDSVSEIDKESLPEKFVAKDTLGGGGNSVYICKDKNKLNWDEFFTIANRWLKRPNSYRGGGREWVYGGKHRIIIEEYIDHDENVGLIDYKFLCFNGRVEYVYVISNRVLGKSAELGIYDRNFNKLDVYREDEKPAIQVVKKPIRYRDMVNIAESLSKPFPYARIDLYNIGNEIRFGEVTLTDGSGYMKFIPDSFDFELGKKFDVKSFMNCE